MLKRSSSNSVPQYIRMITPLEVYPKCSSVEALRDLWWHPLLSEKGATPSLVKRVEFIRLPMELITPGPAGPRHRFDGLAIFVISPSLPKILPRMLHTEDPISSIEEQPPYILDVPVVALPIVYAFMEDPGMSGAAIGRVSRSPGHTADAPRTIVEIRLHRSISALEQELRMRRVRSAALPPDSFYGSHAMFSDPAALIADLAHPSAACKAWPLCSGLILLSSQKALLLTEAEADTWQPVLDKALQEDTGTAILKLQWKPSRHGGREYAVPSATAQQLAALRRTRAPRTRRAARLESVTDAEIRGAASADENE
ncbi:unnamed protein product, partial [Prorocentrum cordatum]